MTDLENKLLERLITSKKRLLVIDELLKQFLLQSNNMTHRHKDSRLNHILQIIETWNN